MLRVLNKQVLFDPETGLQRHHDLLAQWIDRRVGDLGELLAEIIVQGPDLAGEHREGGVVPHRADRLLRALGEYAEHLVEFLQRNLKQFLRSAKLCGIRTVQVLRLFLAPGFQAHRVLLQPRATWPATLQVVLDHRRCQQPAGTGIHRQHIAGCETSAGDHLLRCGFCHAALRGEGDDPVACDNVAGRAQTVTVHDAGSIAAVGQHDAGRAVPRFHVHGVVFVEGPQVGVHGLDVLPGTRDQQSHGEKDIHATGQQGLQHVVEAAGIGARHRHPGTDGIHVGDQRCLEFVAARLCPVAVALDSIDLSVVRQVAKRLRQSPLWPGVGGETLVEHAQRGLQPLIAQIRVEHRQVVRHDEALVADHLAGEAGDVELAVLVANGLHGAAPGDKQAPLQFVPGQLRQCVDKYLLDPGQALQGALAAGRRFDGHRAPAGNDEVLRLELEFQPPASRLCRFLLAAQEEHSHGVAWREFDTGIPGDRLQEGVRQFHQQPASVAALAVRSHRPAVGKTRECPDRHVHQLMTRPAVHMRDQAEAAAVVLENRTV